jgi:hypothetical protein
MSAGRATAFAAAMRAVEETPDQPGAAAIVATQDAAGARLVYSRGDGRAVLDLARAVMGHAAPDSPATGRVLAAFWIWTDLDGMGERWRLAVQGGDGEDLDTLRFPFDDFSDDADNFSDCPTVRITPPAPLPETKGGADD